MVPRSGGNEKNCKSIRHNAHQDGSLRYHRYHRLHQTSAQEEGDESHTPTQLHN